MATVFSDPVQIGPDDLHLHFVGQTWLLGRPGLGFRAHVEVSAVGFSPPPASVVKIAGGRNATSATDLAGGVEAYIDPSTKVPHADWSLPKGDVDLSGMWARAVWIEDD